MELIFLSAFIIVSVVVSKELHFSHSLCNQPHTEAIKSAEIAYFPAVGVMTV